MKAQDLKNSILQLAIQGKLVPQDANDEPAEVLYAKIQAEKQKLIKEGKIKKDKPLPPITDEEIPFEIPSTWKWVRFGDIVKYAMGKTPSRNDYEMWGEGYPWVSIADLIDGKTIYSTKEQVSEKSCKEVFKGNIIPAGTLLMSFKLTIGKVSILGFDGFHNEAIISIFPHINTEKITTMYLFKLLPYLTFFSTETKTAVKGITLNSDSISKLLIPLPPLAEQKRIVDKIEELEPLVKQYDKAETELSVLNDSFPEQLKKSILQYAIQGKLVEQDVNDEPAEVLYAKIHAEKQKLIKEGKIKKDKPLPPITDDEIPFSIPSTWKWVRLGDVVQIMNGYAFQSSNYITLSQNQLIRLGNVKNDDIILNNKVVYISEEDAQKAKDFKILNNDILVTLTGTRYKRDYFYTAVYHKNNEDNTLYLNQRVGLFRIYRELINAELLSIMLKNKYLLDVIFGTETGTVNQGNIGTGNVAKLLIPLPPLAEQHRIVAKVTELMQYCEKLQEWYNKVGKRDV